MNDSREHIMQTAYTLFLQKSYKAVTLREIISKSGFSNGAFYHYFRTKEELFREVANSYWFKIMYLPISVSDECTLHQFIEESIKRSENIFLKLSRHVQFEDESINFYSFIFEVYRIIPELKEKTFKALNQELSSWIKVIDNAKKNKEIKSNLPSENITQLFMNTIYGNGLISFIDQDMQVMISKTRSLWEGLYTLLKE